MDEGKSGTEGAIAELRALVEAQAAALATQASALAKQQERIDELLGHLEATSDEPAAIAPPAVGVVDAATPDASGHPTPSRRALLRRGTAAAAGAAIVGTALSVTNATPAAAASGTFDGSPAVQGTANPTTGIGVRGTTQSGIGVIGEANAVSGNTRGVFGSAASSSGTGVRGENLSTTGSTRGVVGFVQSPSGIAVAGTATVGTGSATGVQGTTFSDDGIGVQGRSQSATGTGVGVYGEAASPNGVGVAGDALTGTAIRAQSGRTQLRFGGAPQPPLSVALTRQNGELVWDTNGDLWLCIGAGAPGTWRRVSGTNTVGSLQLLTATTRIYDSRPGTQPPGVQKGKFQNHEERAISASLGGAVPPTATAVLINATATNTNPGGFFAFFKDLSVWPNNSSLNWGSPNMTIANLAVVAVTAAKFKARMEGAGGADLVIDCIGYYH